MPEEKNLQPVTYHIQVIGHLWIGSLASYEYTVREEGDTPIEEVAKHVPALAGDFQDVVDFCILSSTPCSCCGALVEKVVREWRDLQSASVYIDGEE